MTVQEIINQLNKVEDKTKMIYVHVGTDEIDILEVESVDDRADLNAII